MTRLHIVAAFAVAASVVQSHFSFVRLAVNGEWQEPLRFIRNKTSPYEEASTPNTNVNTRYYNFPTYPSDYPESVRCGRGNLAHGAETEVLTVKAGDTIEVAHSRAEPSEWNRVRWDGCAEGRGSCYVAGTPPHEYMDFNHQGPLLAHLSRVPDGEDVHSYDGSGEWTKIHSLGLELNDDGSLHWLAYNYQGLPGRFVFKIPEQTPAGEYLLRMDLIWPALVYLSSKGDDAQMYPTCAQIVVESDIDGDLPQGIRIPEDIMGEGVPGMSSSLSMYRDESLDEGYVYPVGLLWTGEELVEDKPKI